MHHLVCSVFLDDGVIVGDEVTINHHNLLEPFYVNVAINMNNMYNPTYKQELFKYKITTLISKIIVTTTPDLCRDLMQFVSYAETFSYVEDLKKFRPKMRIQAFIEYREHQGGKLTAEQERKRKAVVRDWWRMVLWYVRLRRAAKTGKIHEDLLIAERMSRPNYNNADPIGLVRSATLTQ